MILVMKMMKTRFITCNHRWDSDDYNYYGGIPGLIPTRSVPVLNVQKNKFALLGVLFVLISIVLMLVFQKGRVGNESTT